MFQRILVAVDEGVLAEHAVTAGQQLAEAFEASLELVHVVDLEPPRWKRVAKERWAAWRAQALSLAWNARVADLEERYGGHDTLVEVLRVVPGHPGKALVEEALATNAGLIVIGAHRTRRFVDFGGTTRALLASSPCPVWIQTTPPARIRRVLAPVDMSPSSALCLETARSVARAFEADVEVLHSYQPAVYSLDTAAGLQDAGAFFGEADLRQAEREAFERHVAELDWTDVAVTTSFVDGDPVEAILARHAEFDLVVVGTHGHSAVARALLGSCAYGVVARSSRPVLAVPQDERLFLPPGGATNVARPASAESRPCRSPS